MSTPVVTDRWAGQFDCDFCRRKRLVGDEFSKKSLERYRKNGGPLKCKACVSNQERKEREAAAAKQKTKTTADKEESRVCTMCRESLSFSSYNRNQWSKGEGKSKCRSCVDKALAQESKDLEQSKQTKIQQATERVQQAKAKGSAQDVLKAESELAALEAEKVTGLKPVSMKRGGRGGRSWRNSSGRGRGRNNKLR